MSDTRGYTLIEAVIVIAIIAVVATMTLRLTARLASQTELDRAAVVIAGALRMVHDRAIHEGTMYLAFFRDEADCTDGRDPVLEVVKDLDGSLTASPGDEITAISFPADTDCRVQSYDPATGPLPNLTLPEEDLRYLASLGVPLLPPVAAQSNDGGSVPSSTILISSKIRKGATFAAATFAGDPVVAFSPTGSPVHPLTPTVWGSGAGGYYLTDGETVVAVIVLASGKVRVRTYHPETGHWHQF